MEKQRAGESGKKMRKKEEIESTADDPKTGEEEMRQGHGSGEAATLDGRSGEAFIRDGDEMEAWSRGGGGVDRRRQKRRRSGQDGGGGGGGGVRGSAEAARVRVRGSGSRWASSGRAYRYIGLGRASPVVPCRPSVLLREPRHGPAVGPGRHGYEH
ncbi:hypothetical protein [Oryza sativa Japonica Group]|uniref:Uncharacterized protein n=1 Tax=Oryza sativa subsp. japonica TaxID=39947 RepID=Q5ZDF5_ORYSJ|nr:hypothetical protein [Oryza sativa Japonica Group]